jgi:hypothetical protein
VYKFRNLNSRKFGYSLYLFAVYEDIASVPITAFPLALRASLWVEPEVKAVFLNKLF